MELYAPNPENRQKLAQDQKLSKLSGMDVKIIFLENPLTVAVTTNGLRGGGSLNQPGAISHSCTAGFSAVSSYTGNPGIITAYHCLINETVTKYTYIGNDGSRYNLIPEPSRNSANHDMVFLAAPKGTPISTSFYEDKTSTVATPIWGVFNRYGISGQRACHFGRTTGYSCGTVVDVAKKVPSLSYMPVPYTSTPIKVCKTNNTYCSATFVKISGDSLKCNTGDSGGPVFQGKYGVGIASSCNYNRVALGETPYLNFSSLEYAYELPAKVAVPQWN